MNIEQIKSVKISLMKAEGDINSETIKGEYIIKGSAKFEFTDFDKNFDERDDGSYFHHLDDESFMIGLSGLLSDMYNTLIKQIDNIDTVGIWIDYNGNIYENAININALSDMKKYGADDIIPIYELFKLTIREK